MIIMNLPIPISLNFHRIVYHTYRDIQLVEMNHVRNTRHVKTPIACLLQEAVRVKGLTAKRKAIRDLLSTAVGEYNKTQTNKVRVNWSSVEISSRFFKMRNVKSENHGCQAFRIKDDLKKVIYGILRCPSELLDLMKQSADSYKWEHGGGA